LSKRFWPHAGGVERYVEDLASEQVRRGHDVRVLTIDRDLVTGLPGRLTRSEYYRGMRIDRVPAIGNSRKQIPIAGFTTIARDYRWADVVHEHDPRFLFETSLLLRRVANRPLLVHTHGLILHTESYAGLKKVLLRRYYIPAMSRLSDGIVADSQGDVDLIRRFASAVPQNLSLIPNAVDLSAYTSISDSTEPGLIVNFGRIAVHKGLDQLLRTVARLRNPWRLEIAGTGPPDLISNLRGLACELGVQDSVRWLGRVSGAELRDLLGRAAVVAFPSTFEGFGIALLEGAAAGRPLVASDIPTHREILGQELSTAHIVDFNSPEAAMAIERLLRATPSERNTLSETLRGRASLFSLNSMVDSIEQLYDRVSVRNRRRDRGR
jgi:glycosyltransferase involved in cell wall biosynthesis